jgi:hypothetical protein
MALRQKTLWLSSFVDHAAAAVYVIDVEIVGRAFLWHQISCVAALLFSWATALRASPLLRYLTSRLCGPGRSTPGRRGAAHPAPLRLR